MERQREAERREVEMVRKSNEILLHLIQDEHREEGDRGYQRSFLKRERSH